MFVTFIYSTPSMGYSKMRTFLQLYASDAAYKGRGFFFAIRQKCNIGTNFIYAVIMFVDITARNHLNFSENSQRKCFGAFLLVCAYPRISLS